MSLRAGQGPWYDTASHPRQGSSLVPSNEGCSSGSSWCRDRSGASVRQDANILSNTPFASKTWYILPDSSLYPSSTGERACGRLPYSHKYVVAVRLDVLAFVLCKY